MKYIYVATGAMIGSTCRYALTLITPMVLFPIHTLLVNCIGSLLLGFVSFHPTLANKWKLLIGVGGLGSFTTFSTFALDLLKLFQQHTNLALLYLLSSLVLGIGFAFIGMKIANAVRSFQ